MNSSGSDSNPWPPNERLRFAGRSVDPKFEPNEDLFLRFMQMTESRRPDPLAIPFPGSDGMSVNRGKYSLPEDARYPVWLNHGVAAFDVSGLPEDVASGDRRLFCCRVRHDPQNVYLKAYDRRFENYAHSLVQAFLRGDSRPAKAVPKLVKTTVRFLLAGRSRVIHEPLPRS